LIGGQGGIQCPVPFPGSSSSSATFNFGNISGTIKIKVQFSGVGDLICDISTKWYTVTVRNFYPGAISGLLFCSPGQTQQLSIPGITPFNTATSCYFHHRYDWIVPEGWTVIPTNNQFYEPIENGIRTFSKTVLLTAPSNPLQQGYEGNYNVTVKTEPQWPYQGTSIGTIWIGSPQQAHYSQIYIPGFYGENPITLAKGSLYQFNIEPVIGASSYQWELPQGFTFMSNQNTTYESVFIWTGNQSGTFVLKCYPQGICGTIGTGYSSLYINLPGSGGGSGTPGCEEPPCLVPQPLRVFPNPAKGQITISLATEQSNFTAGEETEITLYNKFQQKIYSTKTTNLEIVIPTNTLPNDIYHLMIRNKKESVTRQIIIEN
jgi:hypothetical protein